MRLFFEGSMLLKTKKTFGVFRKNLKTINQNNGL